MHSRYELAAPHLSGHGIEIGAGPYPQLLPPGCRVTHFDKRNAEELAAYFAASPSDQEVYPLAEAARHFPQGADFLVAHHVLEHCADVIGTLIEWLALLRDGGILMLSLPSAEHTPDGGRLSPTVHHLAGDYLLARDDDAFESREHVYSFVAGWIDQGFCAGLDKFAAMAGAHQAAHAPVNDLHWHAFTPELVEDLLRAAAWLGGYRFETLEMRRPDSGDSRDNEVTAVLRVYRGVRAPGAAKLVELATAYRRQMMTELALHVFEEGAISTRDRAGGGKVYLCREGRRHWITSPDVFQRLGLAWPTVRYLPLQDLLLLPEGEPIT